MTSLVSAANLARLAAGQLVQRDFITFVVRDRTTGAAVTDNYWTDIYAIAADVIDPDTGGVATRNCASASGLISISDIPLVSNLTVQTVTIKLSQVSDHVNNLLRVYDCKQGRVQIFRGMLDPGTRNLVAPADPVFVGTIDQAPITTPPENDPSGDATLTCTGSVIELTRTNSDTRSDASQRLRSATDDFLVDAEVAHTWQQFWGKEGGVVRTSSLSVAGALASKLGGGLGGVFK